MGNMTASSSTPTTATPRLSADVIARGVARVRHSDGAEMQERTAVLTGEVLGALPVSTPADVAAAYADAHAAQTEWAKLPVAERVKFLEKLHDIVLDRQRELLDLIQLESGKTRLQAFDEVLDVAGVCRHYAKKAPQYLAPRSALGAIPFLTESKTHFRPKGVVGIVAPWNYPLSMCITDALPALAAGNAVVLRPDEKTAFTAMSIISMVDEAGLAEGLLQVVLGDGPNIGAAVLERADFVMFTGSTATGRRIAAQAGERLVPASLELGGKNAMYIAADADLKAAAECAQRAVFASAGQLCVSIERLIVHEDVADEFTKLFVDRVKKMRLSNTLDWGADMGSLISAEQFETVASHVKDALDKGATLLAGGKPRPELGPYFFEPTVLTNVTEEMTCRRNETFGPVVSIYRVGSDAEGIEFANDSEYGLNAAVWTKDLKRGREIAAQIKAGTVNVNEGYAAAFASYSSVMGGMKASGLGRRHGVEGIVKYTDIQNVATQRGPGFGVPRGMKQQHFTKALTLSLKAMKKAGLA